MRDLLRCEFTSEHLGEGCLWTSSSQNASVSAEEKRTFWKENISVFTPSAPSTNAQRSRSFTLSVASKPS